MGDVRHAVNFVAVAQRNGDPRKFEIEPEGGRLPGVPQKKKECAQPEPEHVRMKTVSHDFSPVGADGLVIKPQKPAGGGVLENGEKNRPEPRYAGFLVSTKTQAGRAVLNGFNREGFIHFIHFGTTSVAENFSGFSRTLNV